MHDRGTESSTRTSPTELPPVTAWERASFSAARLVLRAALRLVSLSGLYRLGQALATLEWLTNYKRRRRFARMLIEILGDELSPADVRRASWRHFVRMRNDKIFYLMFDLLPPETIRRCFTITNRHLVDDGLAAKRGVYLAMSHQGSQHVALVHLRAAGYPIGGVRLAKEGAMRRFMLNRFESTDWARVQYFGNDVFPRQLFRWLGDNALLASAMDASRVHDDKQKTVGVTMFNRPRDLLTGPIELAARCGAPAVQAFIISRPGFRYEYHVQELLPDPQPRTNLSDEELSAILQTYADRVEAFTRKYPCHVSRI